MPKRLNPKKKGKKKVDIVIERRVHWNRAAYKATPVVPETKREVVEAKRPSPAPQTRDSDKALNKHEALYRRPLNPHEETIIKVEFLKLNGVFEPLKKDCTRIKNLLGDEVSVFQVSGYVTRLHKLAMSGELEMKDRRAYLATLRSHRNHWLTYEGEKYDEMREAAKASARKPKFGVRVEPARDKAPRHKVLR